MSLPDAPPARALMSERRTAWLASMLVGLGSMCMPLFSPALPDLALHFGVDDATGKLTLSVYLAGFVSMQLICGPLSDRLGRRPVATAFALIFIGSSAAALFAPNIWVFLLARLLQGVGAAAGVAVGRAIILDQFEAARAVPVMTLVSLILAVAPAVAPVIGGAAVAMGSWPAALETMLVLGVVQLVVIRLCLRETRLPNTLSLRVPVLVGNYVAMLGQPLFLWPTLCAAGATVIFQTQAIVLPFLLVDRLGVSEFGFGLVMLAISCSYLVGNLISRHILRRHDRGLPVAIGVSLMVLAALLYGALQLAVGPRVWTVMLPAGLTGVAGSMIFPGMIAMALLPFRAMPGAAAAMNMFVQFALALLVALALSGVDSPVMGLGLALAVAAALTLGSWVMWRRRPDRLG